MVSKHCRILFAPFLLFSSCIQSSTVHSRQHSHSSLHSGTKRVLVHFEADYPSAAVPPKGPEEYARQLRDREEIIAAAARRASHSAVPRPNVAHCMDYPTADVMEKHHLVRCGAFMGRREGNKLHCFAICYQRAADAATNPNMLTLQQIRNGDRAATPTPILVPRVAHEVSTVQGDIPHAHLASSPVEIAPAEFTASTRSAGSHSVRQSAIEASQRASAVASQRAASSDRESRSQDDEQTMDTRLQGFPEHPPPVDSSIASMATLGDKSATSIVSAQEGSDSDASNDGEAGDVSEGLDTSSSSSASSSSTSSSAASSSPQESSSPDEAEEGEIEAEGSAAEARESSPASSSYGESEVGESSAASASEASDDIEDDENDTKEALGRDITGKISDGPLDPSIGGSAGSEKGPTGQGGVQSQASIQSNAAVGITDGAVDSQRTSQEGEDDQSEGQSPSESIREDDTASEEASPGSTESEESSPESTDTESEQSSPGSPEEEMNESAQSNSMQEGEESQGDDDYDPPAPMVQPDARHALASDTRPSGFSDDRIPSSHSLRRGSLASTPSGATQTSSHSAAPTSSPESEKLSSSSSVSEYADQKLPLLQKLKEIVQRYIASAREPSSNKKRGTTPSPSSSRSLSPTSQDQGRDQSFLPPLAPTLTPKTVEASSSMSASPKRTSASSRSDGSTESQHQTHSPRTVHISPSPKENFLPSPEESPRRSNTQPRSISPQRSHRSASPTSSAHSTASSRSIESAHETADLDDEALSDVASYATPSDVNTSSSSAAEDQDEPLTDEETGTIPYNLSYPESSDEMSHHGTATSEGSSEAEEEDESEDIKEAAQPRTPSHVFIMFPPQQFTGETPPTPQSSIERPIMAPSSSHNDAELHQGVQGREDIPQQNFLSSLDSGNIAKSPLVRSNATSDGQAQALMLQKQLESALATLFSDILLTGSSRHHAAYTGQQALQGASQQSSEQVRDRVADIMLSPEVRREILYLLHHLLDTPLHMRVTKSVDFSVGGTTVMHASPQSVTFQHHPAAAHASTAPSSPTQLPHLPVLAARGAMIVPVSSNDDVLPNIQPFHMSNNQTGNTDLSSSLEKLEQILERSHFPQEKQRQVLEEALKEVLQEKAGLDGSREVGNVDEDDDYVTTTTAMSDDDEEDSLDDHSIGGSAGESSRGRVMAVQRLESPLEPASSVDDGEEHHDSDGDDEEAAAADDDGEGLERSPSKESAELHPLLEALQRRLRLSTEARGLDELSKEQLRKVQQQHRHHQRKQDPSPPQQPQQQPDDITYNHRDISGRTPTLSSSHRTASSSASEMNSSDRGSSDRGVVDDYDDDDYDHDAAIDDDIDGDEQAQLKALATAYLLEPRRFVA